MHRSTSRRGHWPLALMFCGLGACADEPAAPKIRPVSKPNANLGDVITVTTTSGGKDVGSLRWAVAQATGGEVIRFAPDLAGDTIVVDSTIVVPYPITIEGPADKGVTISGGYETNIFHIGPLLPSAATLRNLALVNGKGAGSAGGGGFTAESDVVLENVTISNHSGIYYAAFYTSANATLINTTISRNTSGAYAAVWVGKKLTLVNSTIADNNKGGVAVRGLLAMRNSIIARNGTGGNCQEVVTIERNGRNLADDSTCGDTSAAMLIADAKLDSLRYNGGPAKTHALTRLSPAVNGGKDCTVTVDERNVARDATCDIGAFEFTDFTKVTVTTNASLPVDPSNGWVMVAGSITCSHDETFDLAVEVSQEQKVGRASGVVQAAGKVTVTCSTTAQPWGIVLAPSSGVFGNGNAVVTTKTEASAWVTPATASTPVRLYWGRK